MIRFGSAVRPARGAQHLVSPAGTSLGTPDWAPTITPSPIVT